MSYSGDRTGGIRRWPRYRHILDGYKVLDFSQAVAGPTVTRMTGRDGRGGHQGGNCAGGRSDPAELQARRPAQFAVRAAQPRQEKPVPTGQEPRRIGDPQGAGASRSTSWWRISARARSPGWDSATTSSARSIRASSCARFRPSAKAVRWPPKPGFDTIGAAYAGIIDVTGRTRRTARFSRHRHRRHLGRAQRRRFDRLRPAPSRAQRQGPVPRYLAARRLLPQPRNQRPGLQREPRRD